MLAERLAGRIEREKGVRRKLRGLRNGDPPEAWALLYSLPEAENLPQDLLRAVGIVVGHFDHRSGLHPATLLGEKGEGGFRRLRRVLRAQGPVELAVELSRMAGYIGKALDYVETEKALMRWGEEEKISWARKFNEGRKEVSR